MATEPDPAHRATLSVAVGASAASLAAYAARPVKGTGYWLLMITTAVFAVVAVAAFVFALFQWRRYRLDRKLLPIRRLVEEGEAFLVGLGIHDQGFFIGVEARKFGAIWLGKARAILGEAHDPRLTPEGAGHSRQVISETLDKLRALQTDFRRPMNPM